jgi:hypothetical protein
LGNAPRIGEQGFRGPGTLWVRTVLVFISNFISYEVRGPLFSRLAVYVR